MRTKKKNPCQSIETAKYEESGCPSHCQPSKTATYPCVRKRKIKKKKNNI